MVYKIVVSGKAQKDLQGILLWYENYSIEAADKFLDEVDKTVHKIASFPSHYKTVTTGIQRCIIKTFPFIIYFSHQSELIVILRFQHKKQRTLKRLR